MFFTACLVRPSVRPGWSGGSLEVVNDFQLFLPENSSDKLTENYPKNTSKTNRTPRSSSPENAILQINQSEP